MRNLSVLVTAIEIIEENLRTPLDVERLAGECYSSSSGLQKLFGYALRCSVGDYITKRRLCGAARELLESGVSVTDIALDYQYGSPEAFSRAFKRVWGIPPQRFRKTRRFPDLHPKLKIEGEIIMTKRKLVDISELYDELCKMKNTYVLGVDMQNLSVINQTHGRAAGDALIAEAFARLENAIGEDMLLFRVGGDEFAVVTGYADSADALALARAITARNGETVAFGGSKLPLSLRVGVILSGERVNYRGILDNLYESIEEARRTGENVALLEAQDK